MFELQIAIGLMIATIAITAAGIRVEARAAAAEHTTESPPDR